MRENARIGVGVLFSYVMDNRGTVVHDPMRFLDESCVEV
jgi:hypothetical protein